MSTPYPSEQEFLQEATPAQLEEAVAWNHRERYVLDALAAGGEVQEAEGVTWTFAGSRGDSMILFPRLTDAVAGEQLDAIVDYYRARKPENDLFNPSAASRKGRGPGPPMTVLTLPPPWAFR